MIPLVSILIPAYNSERWIAEAIASAVNDDLLSPDKIASQTAIAEQSPRMLLSSGWSARAGTAVSAGG